MKGWWSSLFTLLVILAATPCVPGFTSEAGRFLIEVCPSGGESYRVDVTVENGPQLDFRKRIYRKGNQLLVDTEDFPTLARTGLHSEAELNATRTITGKPVEEITHDAKPGASSTAGFLAHDEDVISVLKADNRTVAKLGLTHRQLAEPLFHVWNMVLAGYESGLVTRQWDIDHILYKSRKIQLQIAGSRGFQESIFNDEIKGNSQIVIRREPDLGELEFLSSRYTPQQLSSVLASLGSFHTGEMVPYYIMRYGFYEGHTSYRADPVAIAFIFGLRSIEEIEAAFPGQLHVVLGGHS